MASNTVISDNSHCGHFVEGEFLSPLALLQDHIAGQVFQAVLVTVCQV